MMKIMGKEPGPGKRAGFWSEATRYASCNKDESFVEEIAYVMVALHRAGV